MSQRLISTLKLFGVDAQLSYTVQGPVVTKYAIELAPGTRYSAVTNLTDNLKGALHAKSIRIEAPIPGEDRIGIEDYFWQDEPADAESFIPAWTGEGVVRA